MIAHVWRDAELVCRASGHYAMPFKSKRGVTQGDPLSMAIFKCMVDAIVREWMWILRDEHDMRFKDVWRLLACFYVDGGLVVARNPDDLKITFNVLIGLIDLIGLKSNTIKIKVMVFRPGRIRTPLKADAYKWPASAKS